MPKKRPTLRAWLFRIYLFGWFAYFVSSAWKRAPRDELGGMNVSALLLSLLWPVGIAVLIAGLFWLLHKFSNVLKSPPEIDSAMPLWLSDRRLTYVPARMLFGTSLPLDQIKTAGLDYAEGSLAVKLKTTTETLNLLSSDAENLLKNLYTLRPDLEPTS